jgi:membrane protease YdiL (CAAX protease family)
MTQYVSVAPEGAAREPAELEKAKRKTVNWPHVWAYIGLAFGLSWLVDLVVYLNGGLTNPATGLLLQLQMLMPAFAALVLGVFFFKESRVYHRTNQTASRWFIYYYFLMTIAYVAGAAAGLVQPSLVTSLNGGLLLFSVAGLVLLAVLRWRGGPQSFAGAGMAFGRIRVWLLYGLGMVVFYGLETLLNYVFKLGTLVDASKLFPPEAAGTMPAGALLAAAFFNAVIIGPLLGLIITFGEEYGWRGYLQGELVRLGRIRGVGLLGIIWGVWHWPIIWLGYNYPGQPVAGSLLMTGYTVALSYFLAYAVFKSKGLWTAAYLHALNNQAMSFFMALVVMPVSMAMSFGIGLPALALCALVVLLILRDPVWKEQDS